MTKSYIFEALQKFHSRYIGKIMRNTGQNLYETGVKLSRGQIALDQFIPTFTKVKINEISPSFSNKTFLAPNNTLIGNIKIGDGTNIYYSNIIKTAEKNSTIEIGINSNIQDLNIIKSNEEKSLKIGKGVYVGSNCYLEDCVIEDEVIIGNGAKILANCLIGKRAFIGAGSVIKENTIVGTEEIWVGNPAKMIRKIGEAEVEYRDELLEQFDKLSFILAEQYEKDGSRILKDKDNAGISQELFGKFDDYYDENEEIKLSQQEYLKKDLIDFEFKDFQMKEGIVKNKNFTEEGTDFNMESYPKHLNINKKNYKSDEKFEQELLRENLPDETFYKENQENSQDPGFSRKF